jgi:FkbM family methyltransferase
MGSTTERRNAFYEKASEFTPFLAASTHSGFFLMDTADRHIGKSLFAKRGRGEQHILPRAVHVIEALTGPEAIKGSTFIDVGANIGTTTVPAVLVYGFGDALAFEPEAENFRVLRMNAVLNRLDDRLRAMQVAVSNTAGTLELAVVPEQGGKHWLVTDQAKKRHAGERTTYVTVPVATLDGLVAEQAFDPESTGLLWIDAQAHEGQILDGARELTSRGVPVVFEWDPVSLDRVGNRGMLQDIAATHYSHFADMRANTSGSGPKFELRPTALLPDYAAKFLDPKQAATFTDILLLRLGDEQLPSADLGVVLRDYVREHVGLAAAPPPAIGQQAYSESHRRKQKAAWASAKARRAQLKQKGTE